MVNWVELGVGNFTRKEQDKEPGNYILNDTLLECECYKRGKRNVVDWGEKLEGGGKLATYILFY